MIALVVHLVLGVVSVWLVVRANPLAVRRVVGGPALTLLEAAYLLVGVVSIALGYWFNYQFVQDYRPADGGNAFTGPGSWTDFTAKIFDNPASASAGQDYIWINLVVLPLFTIVDGYRRGLRRPWLFFVATLFTSCAFGLCLYLYVAERARRHGAWSERPAPQAVGFGG
ncbi:DUF2834 domain-containing protein [Nocardioides sp.]|uniref:DUF2834 domain-containing protein n=1 Tax=Nocardioides sp. TaxID=35761 RepID=UPI001A187497|nr:DUF2834 domain-containing protein [Nocardioides sp.]MBJ7359635.1 DUF2834 domain-containing protein [Nocardioides sp.]